MPQDHHSFPIDADLAPDDPAGPSVLHRPTAHIHRSRQVAEIAAIAAGGFVGTLGRYEAALTWPAQPGRFPWNTFVLNTSGAFLLGLILTLLLGRSDRAQFLRPFLCVGVLGAWTTMSTFAVDTEALVRDGQRTTAVVYVVATVVAGVVVASAGIRTGERVSTRPGERVDTRRAR